MSKIHAIGFLLCWFAAAAWSPPARPVDSPLVLEKGTVLEHIACAQHPEQSYALYLPSNYSPDRRWPIVYSFDPAARGRVPVELQREAAERYGYILAASNNSKNGSWKVEFEAADAMLRDTHARLSIDDHALYLAGFSGGARVASQLALLCKCATGVLLSGAGFAGNSAPTRDAAVFEVFSAVGMLDFNYQELVPLQEKLQQAGFPRWLYIFDGPHQWAPAEAMEQALAWFRLQAMKANRQPRDGAFISAQFSQAVSGANSAEHSGDLLSAYREYLQIADTFDGLTDVSAPRAKAELLGKEKSFHEAAKQERRDFDEQLRLSAEVLKSISAPDENTRGQLETNGSAEDKARALRVRTEEEKRASRTLVYKRALADAFVGAMESGGAYLENRDYVRVVRAFSAATEAAPNSEWAWGSLACAHGVAGNRKDALSALRRARTVAKDKTAFAAWAKTEPAFERIRSAPEFQELLRLD